MAGLVAWAGCKMPRFIVAFLATVIIDVTACGIAQIPGDAYALPRPTHAALAASINTGENLDLVPVVLGAGIRLFEDGHVPIDLVVMAASGTPTETHLTSRLVSRR
jgi:hypothetical protein